jgi:hypothetical protein
LGARIPLSIVLPWPNAAWLSRRIYRSQHETLGAFDLFIVPIGPAESRTQYEAVFG